MVGHWECENEMCVREVAVGTAALHYPVLGRSVDVPHGTALNFSDESAPDFDTVKRIPGAVVRPYTSPNAEHEDPLQKRARKVECMPVGIPPLETMERKFPKCRGEVREKKGAHNCKAIGFKRYFCCIVLTKTAGQKRHPVAFDDAATNLNSLSGLETRGKLKGKGKGKGKGAAGPSSALPSPSGSWGADRADKSGHVLRDSYKCVCGKPEDFPGAELGNCYRG